MSDPTGFIEFEVQNVPRDLHEQVKRMAKGRMRISIRQFYIEAVREKLKREEARYGKA